jgi:hypothetical protein
MPRLARVSLVDIPQHIIEDTTTVKYVSEMKSI